VKRLLILFCILILSGKARAKLEFPKQLTHQDRTRVLEILGYGSALRVLQNPYPLGGYSGIEVGVSNEMIPTSDISHLGAKNTEQGETSYMQLHFAKGLYDNIDLMATFAPMGQNEQISSFGGGARWGFYEAEYFPVALSVQTTLNSSGFQDKVNVSTQTIDLIASINVSDMTLYAGGGRIRASGQFIGGASGITDQSNNDTENEVLSSTRFLAGLSVKFSNTFFAIELDHTVDASYAAELGLRF